MELVFMLHTRYINNERRAPARMKKRSLSTNALLNAIKTLFSILFPLITFPYVSRIIQVENLGKISFGESIISYFSLIAALGISNYAIREGAGLREKKEEMSTFASQIFSINMITTVVAYGMLAVIMACSQKLIQNKSLLFIQSLVILFTTLGVDWLFSIYEEYMYITIRSLLFQVISLLALFVFVKDQDDYLRYAMITVFSSVGANILNFIRARKYCRIRLTAKMDFVRHIKPMLILFFNTIAVTIYVNSDSTMIGYLVGDYSLGIYSVATKVYMIVKRVFNAFIIVTLPSLSICISEGRRDVYKKKLENIANVLVVLVLPAAVGINVLCREIILVLSGENYLEAAPALHILSIALVFAVLASFMTTSILLPMKLENCILKATGISAVLNISLNFIFIPLYKQNGAAVTTVLAEGAVLVIAACYARRQIRLEGIIRNAVSSLAGCVGIVLVSLILKQLIMNLVIRIVCIVGCIF